MKYLKKIFLWKVQLFASQKYKNEHCVSATTTYIIEWNKKCNVYVWERVYVVWWINWIKFPKLLCTGLHQACMLMGARPKIAVWFGLWGELFWFQPLLVKYICHIILYSHKTGYVHTHVFHLQRRKSFLTKYPKLQELFKVESSKSKRLH